MVRNKVLSFCWRMLLVACCWSFFACGKPVRDAVPASAVAGEMARDGRKFAFLCAHDLNLGSVLTALSAAPDELPGAIETRTPIGGKLVFSRWLSPNGDVFWDVDLVYQTPEQLRDVDILTAVHSPAVLDLSFEDLPQTDDGLFPEAALMARFDFAIGEYESMAALYGRP